MLWPTDENEYKADAEPALGGPEGAAAFVCKVFTKDHPIDVRVRTPPRTQSSEATSGKPFIKSEAS